MKTSLFVLLSLISSVAMADGFRCQGDHYRVKLFNETQPARGTRNPAAFVVYEKGVGTIARLTSEEIEKTIRGETVLYAGQSNSQRDGKTISVSLRVKKEAEETGALQGLHIARLSLYANSESRIETLACERYRKQDQR